MLSMTGFGRCEWEQDGRRITVELKTVNNRYLDMNLRMPKGLSAQEEILRSRIKDRLARGHVDGFVTYQNLRQDAKTVTVDMPLAMGYLKAADEVAALGLEKRISALDILRLPDMVTVTQPEEDADALNALVLAATDRALDQLIAMRAKEGENLKRDLLEKLAAVEGFVARIKERAPLVVEDYRSRLTQRVKELLDGQTVLDEGRLANEVAIFSDRCSIAEELARLDSHIAQAHSLLEEKEPVGRKLDFLVQEFNREANTICSKSNDLTITQAGLALKNEIEKIREQVQNVE